MKEIMTGAFRKFATVSAHIVDSSWVFVAAAVVVAWAASGPIFRFSDA